jgi:hypothetical protein
MRKRTTRPLLLYSTGTWLAYAIAERYYRGMHWIWCSPFFRDDGKFGPTVMPPTAIPGEIHDALYKHVKEGDRHSPFIDKNKIGILNGAKSQKDRSIITARQAVEISAIVKSAQIADFRPVIFIVPFEKVSNLAKVVPPAERAHPLSIEYRIEKLRPGLFDVVELVKS